MAKRFLFFFIFFLILVIVNIFSAFKLVKLGEKTARIKKILAEISQADKLDQQFILSTPPQVLGAQEAQYQVGDARVANLKNFFRKYNSPLYDYAQLIVAVSDRYQFDYRLLPAIAMQESNLCRYIPSDSYNCWGWGIYGDNVMKFTNYEEAIETVALGIKKHYLDKGLVTASKIMEKYTPSSNGSWAHGVNTFLRALE